MKSIQRHKNLVIDFVGMARMKQTVKWHPAGVPSLATAGGNQPQKFYQCKCLHLNAAPPGRQAMRDLDARSIKAMYQNLQQQLGDLEIHRFQGTMNERKMKRAMWIQLSQEIREVAKSM